MTKCFISDIKFSISWHCLRFNTLEESVGNIPNATSELAIWLGVWLHVRVALLKYKRWNISALLLRQWNDMTLTLAENLVGFFKIVGKGRTSAETAI